MFFPKFRVVKPSLLDEKRTGGELEREADSGIKKCPTCNAYILQFYSFKISEAVCDTQTLQNALEN